MVVGRDRDRIVAEARRVLEQGVAARSSRVVGRSRGGTSTWEISGCSAAHLRVRELLAGRTAPAVTEPVIIEVVAGARS